MPKRFPLILFSVAFLFVLLLVLFLWLSNNLNPVRSQLVSDHKTIAQKLENIGNLELVRFNLKDVVEESIKREAFGQDFLLPDSKVLVIVSSEAVACIDMKKMTDADIREEGATIRLLLPPPSICSSRVDHEASKIYDVNLAARLLDPELIENAYRDAEQKVKEKALDEDILNKAKASAVQLLTPLLNGLTSKTVAIEFKAN